MIEEFRSTHPERAIKAEFDLPNAITVNPSRIGQLFSNLLGNALSYGIEIEPVRVTARSNGNIELAVYNQGDRIPGAAMERLFRPFFRGDVRPSEQDLGLGLYIASEIARAHGGKLEVSSTAEETSFTFSMPITLTSN